MADQKISALTSLAQADIAAGTDVLPIVDVGAPSVTKKSTPQAIVGASVNDLAQTWNAGGTTFTAIKMNVTDTASAAGSALIDLQVGGVSQFKVTKAGAVTAVGVAIPTISSTSTLTNKTLSSPTLSGTVAGTPSYSSAQNFPFNSTLGDVKGLNGEARIIDDAGFVSFYNGAETVRSGYLQITSSGTAILANEVSNANFNITTAGTGVLQANGTKVPTISSTDTLSNKTLSGVTIADATNIILNTTTGTKIGTGTSQKLGFFNATPVVQPTAVADATDAASVITQLNALLTRMRNLGLIAT